MRIKIFDSKRQNTIDDLFFKAPFMAVKDKLEGNKDKAKEEERDGKKRADEFVVQPRLFFIEYIVYIVGDIWKTLHVYVLVSEVVSL
jgi:hypothetical protein